jgi:hypothetical protein
MKIPPVSFMGVLLRLNDIDFTPGVRSRISRARFVARRLPALVRRGCGKGVWLDENLCRNAQPSMQTPDHVE